MTKLFKNSVETLVNRALEPEKPKSITPEIPSQPMFYKGTLPDPTGEVSPAALYRNRKVAPRKVSTFNIIMMLFAAAAAIVLYVSNIIAVDQLMGEINTLQTQHRKMLSEQEILKAEINRLSSLERINRKAAEELGLANPKAPPVWLSIDPEKVRTVEEALQKK
ncbi:MAG TPA: FtsL-like putative cell division protein [Bacteroidota bacterium]